MACIAEVQETTPYDKSAAEHHRDESDEENDDDNSDTETNPYSLVSIQSRSSCCKSHTDARKMRFQANKAQVNKLYR